jgi:sirohydrochlorin ferrochelatase
MPVHPVSLLHSDRVPASELGGEPAATFVSFMTEQVERGRRNFIVVPLFFGPSRAVTKYIPEQVDALLSRSPSSASGRQEVVVRVADILWKQPEGEPRLVDILSQSVAQVIRDSGLEMPRVVLVDHGSPLPAVTAVKNAIGAGMRSRFKPKLDVVEAVMERRSGAEYDFNGPLLKDVLIDLSKHAAESLDVVLAMLFLSPGRHAGAGGDIAEICAEAQRTTPGLRIMPTPLVGEHPLLIDILHDRLKEMLRA